MLKRIGEVTLLRKLGVVILGGVLFLVSSQLYGETFKISVSVDRDVVPLNERLVYSKEWAFYFANRLKHFEINEKIQEKIYRQKPFFSIFKKFYYMPITSLRYFKKIKVLNDYNWTLKEIEILEEELKNHK